MTPAECDVSINAEALRQGYDEVRRDGVTFRRGCGAACPWGQRAKDAVVAMMPTFGWAIWVAFKRCIYISGLYHMCFAVLQLSLPFLIGELLGYISSGQGGLGRGFGLVVALGVASTASSYCIISTFYEMRRGALQIKAATMMNVYRHSLSLTTASRYRRALTALNPRPRVSPECAAVLCSSAGRSALSDRPQT